MSAQKGIPPKSPKGPEPEAIELIGRTAGSDVPSKQYDSNTIPVGGP
jgi:hypothetical protein